MPEFVPSSSRGSVTVGSAPTVRLELREGDSTSTFYEFQQESILIGTVPGCDLRLPGGNLPPLLCILTCQPQGLRLRKLAPAQPLSINGRPCIDGSLNQSDQVSIGRHVLRLDQLGKPSAAVPASPVASPPQRGEPPAAPSTATDSQDGAASFDAQRKLLEEGIRKLKEAQRQFDEDRGDWEQDAERQAESLAIRSRHALEREKALATAHAELEQHKLRSQQLREELERRDTELRNRAKRQAAEMKELDDFRQQLHGLREDMYAQYRRRRDAVATLREAVDRAAHKVQEEKRALVANAEQRRHEQEALSVQSAQLQAQKTALLQQQQALDARVQEVEREQAEFATARQQLAESARQLHEREALHREDLARLERHNATLDRRQAELESQSQALEQQAAQLEEAVTTVRTRAQAINDGQATLREAETALGRREHEVATTVRQLSDRHTTLETQQAVLVAMRTRVERLQADLLRREQHLTEQRLKQEETESSLRAAARQLQAQQLELQGERAKWSEERRQLEERCNQLEAPLAQFRAVQDSLEQTERALCERQAALAEKEKEIHELGDRIRLRSQKLQKFGRKLLAARQALRDREGHLIQTDETREGLQEQLHRRSAALAERQKHQDELQRQVDEATAALQLAQAEFDAKRLTLTEEAEKRAAELSQRETALRHQSEQLQSAAATVQTSRQAVQQALDHVEAQRLASAEAVEQARQEAARLLAQVPEQARLAQAALERLGKAREQLREHLREVHSYAQQCRSETEKAQTEVADQAAHIRQQQAQAARAQDEHRHAVSAFRQYLSEWQGQLAELKQSLQHGESALQEREARLAEHARRIENSASQLAARAEELEGQERDVAQRRDELHRHLADMQQWYRQKLRELAERRLLHPDTLLEAAEAGPAVLPIRGEPAPGDRQLADLLTSMNLIDADTLQTLISEAQKQNKSLRDALLDGEFLTTFQVESIEADRLEALFVGPLRIVDRLRMTPLETIYRVFDPRRNEELLLRQLSPAMSAEKRVEFRERFARAGTIHHPQLAATVEVLDVAGNPAALQEWVIGVPSSEWAAFAAVPAVWLRLISQVAAGLEAAHEAGLTHGHLHAGRLLLTEAGNLKICGLGEPTWLFPEIEPAGALAGPAADLFALGKIAEAWLSTGLRGRWKRPASEPLDGILQRLLSTSDGERYPSTAALANHLDHVRAQVGDDNVAWDRLMAFVRERLQPAERAEVQRKSA